MEHKLDLYEVLKGEEVLEFSLDDFGLKARTDQIAVQTKELKVYLVDYVLKAVVASDITPQNIVQRSIFQDVQYGMRWERNRVLYEPVKEFIQTQERLGQKVLLPKCNDEFIAVFEPATQLLRLFQL